MSTDNLKTLTDLELAEELNRHRNEAKTLVHLSPEEIDWIKYHASKVLACMREFRARGIPL